jgi:Lon-like ATP-dependent protease
VEEGLTAVLYPHRRIRIIELVEVGGTSGAVIKNAEDKNNTQTTNPPLSPKPPQTNPQNSTLVCSPPLFLTHH